jgi:hypothetical protein
MPILDMRAIFYNRHPLAGDEIGGGIQEGKPAHLPPLFENAIQLLAAERFARKAILPHQRVISSASCRDSPFAAIIFPISFIRLIHWPENLRPRRPTSSTGISFGPTR